MTYKKAKKEIDSRIKLARKHYPEAPDFIEALEVAVEALKRQMPMKPCARFHPDGSVESACPNCREVVEEELFIYCPDCGQAIDWSEE